MAVVALALVLAPATQASTMPFSATPSLSSGPLVSLLPVVRKVQPHEGPRVGGYEVTVSGSDLGGATAVAFGSTAASFTVKSKNEIEAIAPPGTGMVDVTVTTPEGTSAVSPADEFTYVAAMPVVEELSPSSGPVVGKAKIEIKGSGFLGATAVHFGAASAPSFVVKSATIILAAYPVGTGTAEVTVTTPEGTSALSPADIFTYTSGPPEVGSVSPKRAPAAGGTSVGIGGGNFIGASAVEFGAVSARSFTVNSETSITAVIPAESARLVEVTVTTPYGTSGPEFCLGAKPCEVGLDRFTFADPTITGMSVNSGPQAGGTTITVTGTGFAVGETESIFAFNSTRATSVDCVSIMECTIVTPAHPRGPVNVSETVLGTEIRTKSSPAARFTFE